MEKNVTTEIPDTTTARIAMPIQRLSVTSEGGEPVWVEPCKDGRFVAWEEVADLVVKVSGLVCRVEIAHDLHAVFTIKDSEEFQAVKKMVSSIFKST